MNAWRKEFVKSEYEKIQKKLATGVIMGEPIDLNNLEELVLCAYLMGKQEADYEAYKNISFFQKLCGFIKE